MARTHIRHVVEDQAGNVVQNATISVLAQGTTKAVTVYTAETGSSTATLTTNNQGEISGWVDRQQALDFRVADTSDTAFYPNSTAIKLSFATFTETEMPAPNPKDSATSRVTL